MIYRLANDGDLLQLSQMRWDFRTEGKDDQTDCDIQRFLVECTEFLKSGLVNNDWAYWVAEEDREIISHVFIKRIRKVPKPLRLWDEIGYVTNVYTKPQYRGRGIGKTLMGRVKEWAIESDLELLIVWPSERAVPFYEREGFQNKNEILELILRDDLG